MRRLDGNMIASNKDLRGSDDALPNSPWINALADVRRKGRLRAIATITFSRSCLRSISMPKPLQATGSLLKSTAQHRRNEGQHSVAAR
jgi:hypothetical protein